MNANWKDYELYIHRHFQRLFPDASIKHNVRKSGIISKTLRQIDIYIEGEIAGFNLNIVIDCKYFNKKINVKIVESFLSFLQDVQANKGIIITNQGYSKAAYNRATNDTEDLELRILDFQDLDAFQAFYAIAYSGPYCAFLSAPPGWVIDAKIPAKHMVAAMYPCGLTLTEAMESDGFIYVNFSKKNAKFPNLKVLTKSQDIHIKKNFPNAKIEYIEESLRGDAKVLIRVADIDTRYNGLEYTAFIDFGEVIVFLVLLAPHAQDIDYFKKLKWTVEKLTPGRMVFAKDAKFVSVSTDENIKN